MNFIEYFNARKHEKTFSKHHIKLIEELRKMATKKKAKKQVTKKKAKNKKAKKKKAAKR